MIRPEVIERFKVTPGKRLCLADRDPAWVPTQAMEALGKAEVKARAQTMLQRSLAELAAAQERLWANDRWAVLVVLQAMDAAGKDGTIKHVMSGVNPQGCQVFSFKQPSAEELDHDFLWRCARRLPERGRIGIFNRSYYEDVLVVRVHPELLEKQKLPPGRSGTRRWKARSEAINAFEHHLVRSGTIVLKFFLHVSKAEQKRRFLERLEQPDKHWKFSAADVAERAHWDEYMDAYEAALGATSTKWAPWYVIPADRKWITRAVVADVIATALRDLDLRYPETDDDRRAQILAARRVLLAEDEEPA
jgi:PPK2 family polyphosphate:nucleotide phosphotransferase